MNDQKPMKQIQSISEIDLEALERLAEREPILTLDRHLTRACRGFYSVLEWIQGFCPEVSEGFYYDLLNKKMYFLLTDEESGGTVLEIFIYSKEDV